MAENTKKWDETGRRYRSYIKLEKRLSENTVESYMRDYMQFAHFILRQWDVAPHKVEPQMVERYMAWLYERGREKTSQARALSGIKSFFNFLMISDKIESSPAEFVLTPKFGRQLPDVLPILKQNRSEYFVFVGNDPHAVEVMQAMQRPADKIAFGFQSSGGHRDVDKVVSAHVGVDMTIGGATAPLSGVFRYRVKTAFEGAKYKLTFVSDMDGWLKCHLALILPACYLCYACSGDLSKATKEQRDLVLDAAWEACEMLKAAHIPVDDKENTDCYRAGTPGRRKMDAMILALCKTPLGRLCVSDHAMHAVTEMQYLDEAFEGLRTRTSVRMTAWDTLRSQMPSWDIMRKKTAKAKR